MPILDAALAFSLTMLAVATVVTHLVRWLQGLLKIRRVHMGQLLDEFMSDELAPVLDREVHRLGKRLTEATIAEVSKHASAMTKDHLFRITDETVDPAKAKAEADELENLESLATHELIERLKRSEMGKHLLADLNDEADRVFAEVGKRWEAVGERFTESFRTKARWWATWVALGLALVVNIDSWFVLQSYLTNRNLTESVTVRLEQVVESAEEVMAEARADTLAPTDLAELREGFEATKAQVDGLTQAGFPLGWDYYPHACATGTASPSIGCDTWFNAWRIARWLMGIGLTAALAGLGAPFWFDAVRGLGRVARVKKSAS